MRFKKRNNQDDIDEFVNLLTKLEHLEPEFEDDIDLEEEDDENVFEQLTQEQRL